MNPGPSLRTVVLLALAAGGRHACRGHSGLSVEVAPWPVWSRGRAASGCSLGSRARAALNRTRSGCVGLSNYVAFSSSDITFDGTKQDYFAQLRLQKGVIPGWQTAPEGMCLRAVGAAELLPLSCLHRRGYKWMFMEGDSIVRELAVAVVRLAAADEAVHEMCEPRGQNTTLDTKNMRPGRGACCAAAAWAGCGLCMLVRACAYTE